MGCIRAEHGQGLRVMPPTQLQHARAYSSSIKPTRREKLCIQVGEVSSTSTVRSPPTASHTHTNTTHTKKTAPGRSVGCARAERVTNICQLGRKEQDPLDRYANCCRKNFSGCRRGALDIQTTTYESGHAGVSFKSDLQTTVYGRTLGALAASFFFFVNGRKAF